ncbi:hypothetical protein DSO57_1001720 [Entomophthora muscae]|uniref:Uncharacterized protein n=1 Tax=Entomophthora muscae TaxID=34485 RepID=A0ACC2SLY6_9FUNG|nr:hypothetical protein DSO57_1001720 [Entomophthora muscae]
MAKPKAKDKRQTRSQTTRRYETSEEEVIPDTWEERTDIDSNQPCDMETEETGETQHIHEDIGSKKVNTKKETEKVSGEPVNNHTTPPPQRRKDASKSPDRRTQSACSSRP